ncbi:sugar phosphate isomerase/epimerase family protein [Tsukamurella soli]|uniref:Sugar phosphate isomerase/epimerase n=1 Tax=Tsukamurella soli TaxID=644556 RepID=A0ABP8JMI9_9ACTN
MTDLPLRLAAAPISWGVCEVPDWGYQLPPARVLVEMRDLGITATETGPPGYLPTDPDAMRAMLSRYGLGCVGAFAPVVAHEPGHDPVPGIAGTLDRLVASGGDVLVLAAATGRDGYDSRPELDAQGWSTLLANLDRLVAAATARGVRAVLHPHVGTMVEQRPEVYRVLDDSCVPLCLDTGHLLVGGTNPAEVTAYAAERVGLVHLKDVRGALAARVHSGDLGYTDAVRAGMYVPLGAGDTGIAGIVAALLAAGYDGWFVLEQDRVLASEADGDCAAADVAASIGHLRATCERIGVTA